jgi:hypothetical protein
MVGRYVFHPYSWEASARRYDSQAMRMEGNGGIYILWGVNDKKRDICS